jgi:predicted dehydrogenase
MSRATRPRRIGLVGFGSIAENGHLPAWQSFPEVEVAAVADLSPARLDRARELLPGAALYDAPVELIARADVDGVDICTPPNTHAGLILAACRRGLTDVVCEKPLVLSEDEYVEVARARRDSGSRVISVNNWVHSDLNRLVGAAIRDGAIGEVRSVELRIGRPDCALGNAGWMPRWRTDLAFSGGGIILDHGWHQFYLLLGWLQEPLETVSAVTRTVDSRHYPVEDEALIEMLFSSASGRIELSWAAGSRTNEGFIQGSRGSITAHDDAVVVDNGRSQHRLPFRSRLSQSSYHPEWFQAVFLYNVLNESPAEADRNFAEAGVLVSAVRAAYRSAQASGAPYRPTLSLHDPAGSRPAEGTDCSDVRCRNGGVPT